MSKEFNPFKDDSASLQIDELTLENKGDSVAFYGQTDFDASQEGLERLEQVAAVLQKAIAELKGRKDLPAKLEKIAPTEKPNPF
jgi:hypothetical protein